MQRQLLKPDKLTYIPAGTVHRLANPGPLPLHVIEVQCGDYLGEDDIVRIDDCYGRCELKDRPRHSLSMLRQSFSASS